MKTKSLQNVLMLYAIIFFALIAALYLANVSVSVSTLGIDIQTMTAEELAAVELPSATVVVLLLTPLVAAVIAIHIAIGKRKIAHNGKFNGKVWGIMLALYILDAIWFFAFNFLMMFSYLLAIFYVVHKIGQAIVPIDTDIPALENSDNTSNEQVDTNTDPR